MQDIFEVSRCEWRMFLHICLLFYLPIVHTQTPLVGSGLEWAHNLLVLVGLVFPTKGCFWPSDPMTPLIPHEFSLFPP